MFYSNRIYPNIEIKTDGFNLTVLFPEIFEQTLYKQKQLIKFINNISTVLNNYNARYYYNMLEYITELEEYKKEHDFVYHDKLKYDRLVNLRAYYERLNGDQDE